MTMLSPDNDMAVMTALFVIAVIGFMGEKTRIGSHITGAVITILAAITAANLNIIPHQSTAYDFVFTYLVPILIPLFLFKANLKQIFFETNRTTGAFLLASLGTVLGVTVAALVLDLSSLGIHSGLSPAQLEPAIAGLFASTYIGGSVNYAALGEITGLSNDASFFSAATAADNLFSAIYLGMLALLPGWRWLAARYNDHDHREIIKEEQTLPITAMSLMAALAIAMVIVVVGDRISGIIGNGWRYVVISSLTLLLATLCPRLVKQLSGSFELGVGLSFVFFASIAAGADILAMINVAPILISLVLILLSIHCLVTFGLGSLLGLSLPELITASNAAILGATTAPALAATKGWNNLVAPGILVGVFGYALGTFLGTLIFKYWGMFL